MVKVDIRETNSLVRAVEHRGKGFDESKPVHVAHVGQLEIPTRQKEKYFKGKYICSILYSRINGLIC